ncbi:MAG: metallophosphoesterase family protein [Hydrogenophaga sp.]|jgi:predicted phosphodiesterase|uniref:metallophosphoesterase family protein n=1 Tax=Hydrogenophaga sp. TaxID=1904254 RepID=UPI001BBB884B|nr:metallophosphoesterase family protein [Hydrogenophaga sp.]MBS3911443.1 metallophosphoesterase family protein [Hydrogenophaga sp.]MDO9148657.1 metallophosphoesterase family protein [Hydrogenophaga sp.]MDO9605295.1 metallophosphoesterase family protein [Hydrogenophaga sp.]
MRIAAISDIHGNLPALNAVLADIDRRGADLIVNCGDILSGPLWPRETAEVLMALHLPTIAGNHERQLLHCAVALGGSGDVFAYEETTAAQRAWLGTLPACLTLEGGVQVCHGRPDSDLDYLLETVDTTGSRPATPIEVTRRLATSAGQGTSLVLCGHSHLPRMLQLPQAPHTLCVNPGSVGLPAFDDDHIAFHIHQAGTPHARYALCERDTRNAWTVALIAVAYDWQAAADRASRNGATDWARWLATGLV